MGQILSQTNDNNIDNTASSAGNATIDVTHVTADIVNEAYTSVSPSTDTNNTPLETDIAISVTNAVDVATNTDDVESANNATSNATSNAKDNATEVRSKYPGLSAEAKIKLLSELLKTEVNKNAIAREKHARNDFLMKNIVESLRKNNDDLGTENHMLRDSVQHYKRLYMGLLKQSNEECEK